VTGESPPMNGRAWILLLVLAGVLWIARDSVVLALSPGLWPAGTN